MRLAVCIILGIVLFVLTFVAFIFFSRDTYRESKVDVSPVAELSAEHMNLIEDVFKRLREDNSIRGYRVQEQPGAPQLMEIHNFIWIRVDGQRLRVNVSFFQTEQGAIDFIPSESVYRAGSSAIVRSDSERRTFMNFNNGAEAILYDSRMMGYDSNLWFPDSQRHIGTGLRLGHVRIGMTEVRHYLDLDNNITSEFIKMLCEMLKY